MTVSDLELRFRTDDRSEENVAGAALRRSGEFAPPDTARRYAPDLRLEPVHVDLDLRIDLEAERLDATITHRIRANDGDADALTLHGVDLEELSVEGPGLRHGYDGERIELAWDRPFAKGEEREVVLRYVVRHPRSGLLFSRPTPTVPDAPRFAVTDHETERARHWFATVDLPAARPTLAFHLHAEESLTLLANGRRIGEDHHGDGTKTAHWALDAPCPSYLTCFAVGEFARAEGGEVEGVPVAAFAPKATFSEADLARVFGRTAEMLRWLPARLGVPYPYPKYFQFAAQGIGGAMENISLVSWDARLVIDETLSAEEQPLVDIVNLHEMAHAWFGDHVVCRDYAHAWLKESWATYLESCWLEHDQGDDAAAYDRWVCAFQYRKESDERYARPIVTRRFETSWDMYDRHLYPGGAMRLHMLRRLLGDGVFWEATQTYLERFGGRVAETDDFRAVLEEASGRSLARFFDDWLRSPGYPKLRVRFRWDAARREGVFELEQTQATTKGKGAGQVPTFLLPLVFAYTLGGKEERASLTMDEAQAVLRVPMASAPTRVRVDPDQTLLLGLELDVLEDLEHALLTAPDVPSRIEGGRLLAKRGTRRATEALEAAYREESFWGVRAQWAEALGEAASQPASAALTGLVADPPEGDARELAPLFRAARHYRDPELAEAVEARVRAEGAAGLPPRAREAAVEALGAQREAAPFELLAEIAADGSAHPFARAGALRALAA
ncbi:MAG: M1 family aminopeptidase, partial [Myxococcota bacterium]